MLEAWFDPGTIQHLDARGVGAGWHCLEVGAGGGSIAAWLCQQVGEQGRVVATDINTRLVAELDHLALEAMQHNIVADELPEEAFDLVHTRAVLGHLPEREQALSRLAAALKPGGWLAIEEFDIRSAAPDERCCAESAALYRKAVEAHNTVLSARGMDVHYGHSLLGDLRKLPLTDIDAEGRVSILHGGVPGAEAWRLTYEQLRDELVASGEMGDSEVDETLALLSDKEFTFILQILMAAWARRPEV